MEKRGALIIGVSIIIGFLILGLLSRLSIGIGGDNLPSSNRYQMISANDNNIILLDTETSEYWRKFIPTNEGPTNWTKEIGPDLNK